MMFPHTCTIYNKYREGREDKWHRTVLHGVLWDNVRGINARNGAVDNNDSAVIIIPAIGRTGYKPPKKFAAHLCENAKRLPQAVLPFSRMSFSLTHHNKTDVWTINAGDLIVFGEIDFVFDDEHRLADLERQYDDVLTITKVDRRIFGSHLDHWEVGAK